MKRSLIAPAFVALAIALAGCAAVSAQPEDAPERESAPDAVDASTLDPVAADEAEDASEVGNIGDEAVVDANAGDAASAAADAADDAGTTAEDPTFDRDAALNQIDRYLEGLDVMLGSFIQIEPTGAVATGRFWLDRPGRMRFEYDDPHPFTIVADGATYTVWDRELEDVNTRVPLRETPLNMFLRRDVNLARDAIVDEVRRDGDELSVRLEDPDERVQGALTLVFTQPAIELRRMITTDADGADTEITFTDTVREGDIDPGLFVIRDDRRRRGG